jgi:uncharacterized protein
MLRRLFLKDDRLRPVFRVVIYAVAVFAVQYLLSGLIGFRGGFALFECISAIFVVGIAFALRRFLDRRSIDSLGMPLRTRWGRLLTLGLALGAGMQLLVFALEAAVGELKVTGFSSFAVDLRFLPVWIVGFAAAAIAEEMQFRGYVLQNLWEEMGFWPAALVSSALFALLHFGNPNIGAHPWIAAADIAGFGLWACLSIAWTKSLWLALGTHFGWNLFEGPILGAQVSGIGTQSVLSQTVSGPDLLTGGSFGPEAGLYGIAVLAIGLAVLYALQRRGAFAQLPDTREAYAGGPSTVEPVKSVE